MSRTALDTCAYSSSSPLKMKQCIGLDAERVGQPADVHQRYVALATLNSANVAAGNTAFDASPGSVFAKSYRGASRPCSTAREWAPAAHATSEGARARRGLVLRGSRGAGLKDRAFAIPQNSGPKRLPARIQFQSGGAMRLHSLPPASSDHQTSHPRTSTWAA